MITLKLAMAVREVGARAHVCPTGEANKRLEVFRDKLRAVVADGSRLRLRIKLLRSLNDRFDVNLYDVKADIPVEPRSYERGNCDRCGHGVLNHELQ